MRALSLFPTRNPFENTSQTPDRPWLDWALTTGPSLQMKRMVVDFFRILSGHRSPSTYLMIVALPSHWGPSRTRPRFLG